MLPYTALSAVGAPADAAGVAAVVAVAVPEPVALRARIWTLYDVPLATGD